MINVGIIGFGYWGPNLVRNFSAVPGARVSMVSDLRNERLDIVRRSYPSVHTTTDVNELINSPEVDAVVIATPTFTHFPLAKLALENGKHVLLEKPMADSAANVEALVNLAEQKGKVVMVDHTFLYTGAVQKIKDLVDSGEIGKVKYFDSTRVNLGLIQPDVNVLWDLAPHDISILTHLVPERPYSVQATGKSHLQNGIENIAYLTVNYESDVIAHFHCSWSSPVKLRTTLIGGDKKMIVYNDLEATEKVRVYDTGHDVRTDEEKARLQYDYRTGDVYIPKIKHTEALFGMASDFINAIDKGTKPVSDWESGLYVVQILEAAQKSISNRGAEVLITGTEVLSF